MSLFHRCMKCIYFFVHHACTILYEKSNCFGRTIYGRTYSTGVFVPRPSPSAVISNAHDGAGGTGEAAKLGTISPPPLRHSNDTRAYVTEPRVLAAL